MGFWRFWATKPRGGHARVHSAVPRKIWKPQCPESFYCGQANAVAARSNSSASLFSCKKGTCEVQVAEKTILSVINNVLGVSWFFGPMRTKILLFKVQKLAERIFTAWFIVCAEKFTRRAKNARFEDTHTQLDVMTGGNRWPSDVPQPSVLRGLIRFEVRYGDDLFTN